MTPQSQQHESINPDDVWTLHGACFEHPDPDLWFPEEGQSGEEAKRICASCPVRQDCLQHALSEIETIGIWGGASERVRRPLRRLSRQSPHGPFRKIGCRCSFCQALDDHDKRMSALAAGQQPDRVDTRGPNTTHGTPSCYPKGCRRPECLAALREWRAERRALKRLEEARRGEAS